MADPLAWDGECLRVLDQTRLPFEESVLELRDAEAVADAIRRLAVRGAPLIGIAGAYGLAMEVAAQPSLGALERGYELLRSARPTAVNLAWAVDRVREAALAAGPVRLAGAAREAAEAIHAEDEAACLALGELGAQWLDEALGGEARLMTHCNTGALAASGRGTALGVIAALAERRPVSVVACEARPLLQGARLTVWELGRLGLPHALCADSAAAGLIRGGHIDAVVVGFDRVTANGDVVNKVGTYGLALAAAAAGIPFVAAGPSSSLDPSLATGDLVEIENRAEDEVRLVLETPVTVPGTPVLNPAFDVTPAELVTALVTERGVTESRP